MISKSQKAIIYQLWLLHYFAMPLSRELRKGKDGSDLYWHKRSGSDVVTSGCCILMESSGDILMEDSGCIQPEDC